jgi:hypothetical protein
MEKRVVWEKTDWEEFNKFIGREGPIYVKEIVEGLEIENEYIEKVK